MAAAVPINAARGGAAPAPARAPLSREELRARRRQIESQSRHRREQRLRDMRDRATTLRHVLRCLSLEIALRPLLRAEQESVASLATAIDAVINSDDEETDTGDDDDDEDDSEAERRLLPFLRRSMALAVDAKALRDERARLSSQLSKLQHVESSVRTAIAARRADLDDDPVQWSAVARATFTPWTGPAIAAHISDSLEAIHRFTVNTDHVTTGHTFMGWSDSRRLDPHSGQFQFSFSKTFPHTDAAQLFEQFWAMQFDADKLRRYNLGLRTKIRVELVQRVSRDIAIQRRDVQYSGAAKRSHTVLLMFRQKTPTGFMACLRTVPAPVIQHALEDDPDAAWVSHFHWTHIDAVTDAHGVSGCKLSFCGSLATEDMALAHRWMLEIIFMLVRGETTMIGPRKLPMY